MSPSGIAVNQDWRPALDALLPATTATSSSDYLASQPCYDVAWNLQTTAGESSHFGLYTATGPHFFSSFEFDSAPVNHSASNLSERTNTISIPPTPTPHIFASNSTEELSVAQTVDLGVLSTLPMFANSFEPEIDLSLVGTAAMANLSMMPNSPPSPGHQHLQQSFLPMAPSQGTTIETPRVQINPTTL